jgi:hypothetical protein
MIWSPATRRISRWLVWFILALGALHFGLHINEPAVEARFGRHLPRWLDMNTETSIATWFNVGLLQLVAALAVVAAIAAATRRERVAWASLAVAVTLLSVDEKISIHESLPELLGMSQGDMATHEWLIPGVAIALIALLALTFLLRPLPRPVILGLLLAMTVYGAGAVGMETLSGMAVRSLEIGHPIRDLATVWEWIEETLEMLGCVLAFATILRHLERVGVYDPARWRELARTAPSPEVGEKEHVL